LYGSAIPYDGMAPLDELDERIIFEVLFSSNLKIYCKYLLTDHFAPSYGNDMEVVSYYSL